MTEYQPIPEPAANGGVFRDHFSTQADDYARYRPTYPAELFAFLSAQCEGEDCALDVGAGNGQASLPLAGFFRQVIALEPSAEQLRQALPHPHVRYIQSPAEALPVPDHSVDLIVAAQSAHWFDLKRFYDEVRRSAKKGALLALLSYGKAIIRADIDPVVEELYSGVLGPYWPEGRELVENGYRDLFFPFARLPAPEFVIAKNWTSSDFTAYVSTWSALARYRKTGQADPLPEWALRLAAVWQEQARVIWPITLLLAKIDPE